MNQNQSDNHEEEFQTDLFNNAVPSNTIDSRSFTRLTDDWKYETVAENRAIGTNEQDQVTEAQVPVYDSSASIHRNPFKNLFLILFRLIMAGVSFILVSILLVFIYDIHYISTFQVFIAMLPTITMYIVFKFLNKRIYLLESILLVALNFILAYLLFRIVMAHGIQELYSVLSFQEAWNFAEVIKETTEGKELYFDHFVAITGVEIVCSLFLLRIFYSKY